MGAFVEEIEILIGQEGHVREDRLLADHSIDVKIPLGVVLGVR